MVNDKISRENYVRSITSPLVTVFRVLLSNRVGWSSGPSIVLDDITQHVASGKLHSWENERLNVKLLHSIRSFWLCVPPEVSWDPPRSMDDTVRTSAIEQWVIEGFPRDRDIALAPPIGSIKKPDLATNGHFTYMISKGHFSYMISLTWGP